MAENTFGSYSGVPTTSAQGKGTAQSFTPQAIGLDTSQIGKGIAQAGLAAAQIGADYMKSQQEIAKKAEEYEKMKGDYNWSNTLYAQNNADISDLVNNRGKVKIGSISEAKKRLDEAVNLGKDVQVYEQTWKGIYDKADNNTQVWDPSQNAYVGSKDYAKNKLMNPPTQEELDALKNGNLGIVVNKEILGLDQNLLKADTFDQDVIKAAKDFGLKAGTITTESATDKNSIITSVSQYDATQLANLATSIKDNQAMKDQFISQYMLDNGIPPSSKPTLMSDPQIQTAWEEKVDSNIDRLAQRTVTDKKTGLLKVVKGGSGTGSGTDGDYGFNVTLDTTTSKFNPDDKTVSRNYALKVGNAKIGDQNIAGITYKGGKLLALDETGQVIPDSEGLANSYINVQEKGMSDAKSDAFKLAVKDLKTKGAKTTKIDSGLEAEMLGVLEQNASDFGDDEEAFVDYFEGVLADKLNLQMGNEYKKELFEYLKKNDTDFTKESKRQEILNKIASDFPQLFLTEDETESGVISLPTPTASEMEQGIPAQSGTTKNPFAKK